MERTFYHFAIIAEWAFTIIRYMMIWIFFKCLLNMKIGFKHFHPTAMPILLQVITIIVHMI